MQYSLRWLFAATVYVAIASVAFTQADWVSTDFLWAVSLLAVVYALLLACFARGKRQVIAAGFVFASAGFLLCLQFDNVPTARVLYAAGIESRPMAPYPLDGASRPAAVANMPVPVRDFPVYLRAANAVGMMAFGLMGCGLGALAFRAAGAKSAG